jgi:hypothetical protein
MARCCSALSWNRDSQFFRTSICLADPINSDVVHVRRFRSGPYPDNLITTPMTCDNDSVAPGKKLANSDETRRQYDLKNGGIPADNIEIWAGHVSLADYLRSKPNTIWPAEYFGQNHWNLKVKPLHTMPMKSCIPSKRKWHQPCIAESDLEHCSSSNHQSIHFEHNPNSPSVARVFGNQNFLSAVEVDPHLKTCRRDRLAAVQSGC